MAWSPLAAAQTVADPNDFTVVRFSADYYLTNTVPQGQMRIVERITVDYAGFNHGIYRTLPSFYHHLPLAIHINSISSDTGAPASFTAATNGTNEVIKIGDPNRTVTGNQEYTIDYSVQHVVSFYNDHDELYWNVNGTQWQQTFTAVQATLHLPSGTVLSEHAPVCYSGSYGSMTTTCQITKTPDSVVVTAANLSGASTLTFVVGFAKGYFQPPTWSTYMLGYLPYAMQVLVPIVILGGIGFVVWLVRGRGAKGSGVIIPQYDVPNGLSPLEVGALVDFNVENRDVTATLVGLAIRKYVRIIEQDKATLLGVNHRSYVLQLVNKDMRDLNDWEQELLTTLFYANGPASIVSLSAPIPAFQQAVRQVKKSVVHSLTTAGFFVSNPQRYSGHVASVGVAAMWIFIFARFMPVTLISVGVVLGIVTFLLFWHFMPARTAKGAAMNDQLSGLKLYLEVAEKDRIAKLQSPSAPYAAPASAPVHSVDLFEKLLPYAITLKVEREWAQQFAGIYTTPPDWYGGNMGAFSVGYLVGSLGSDFSAATNLSVRSAASGSGFGGGGLAGGGGGGW
jgi:uncharacterized membrane protein YgcG